MERMIARPDPPDPDVLKNRVFSRALVVPEGGIEPPSPFRSDGF